MDLSLSRVDEKDISQYLPAVTLKKTAPDGTEFTLEFKSADDYWEYIERTDNQGEWSGF